MKKFSDSGEKLIISKPTESEFKDGLRGHTDRIRKYDSPRVNSKLFQEVQVQKDIYNYYHKWRMGKANTSLDLFVADIFSIYDNFKRDLKIDTDTKAPFDLQDKTTQEILIDYTSSISNFKSREGNEIIGSATIDAENILWLETKRESKSQNIFDTKFFFISTDQGLRRWDYQRANQTPIVLLPSQWMSILLRYLDRTDDDYKSFVNFLNLKNNEVLIDSEKLHIVLAGISEMTTSLEQQRTILHNLVENKFNGVISRGLNSDQIFENAKKYAKSELEQQVELLNQKNGQLNTKQDTLSSELEIHKTSVSSEIQQLKDDKSVIGQRLSEKEHENLKLKANLIAKEENEELEKWQRPAYWLMALGLILLAFTLLQFCCKTWAYNYPYQLILWIDTITNSVQKSTLTLLMYTPLIGIWLISVYSWNRLTSSDKKKDKLKSISVIFGQTDHPVPI